MSHWETIQEIAVDNYGLVTTSQAVALDISAEESEVFDGIACQPVALAIKACIGRVPSDRLIVAVDEARGQGLISSKSDKELRKVLG